jgi:hypothetical protein
MSIAYIDSARWRDPMLRLRLLAPWLVLNVLSACVAHTPPRATPADAPAAGGIRCHLETTTGSLVATRVCTTAEQRAALRARTQQLQDELNRAPAGCLRGTKCVDGQ